MVPLRLYLCLLPAFLLSFCPETGPELVAKVPETQIGYDHYVDIISDTHVIPHTHSRRSAPPTRRLIRYADTKIRIKHSKGDEYMTVTERNNWPAAAVGKSERFYFILHKSEDGIRIKTLNTTHPGYEWAYSSSAGGIYFDWFRDRNYWIGWWNSPLKQHWSISKAGHLYDGDNVTITNEYYKCNLCYHQGWTTNVYCLAQCKDEWVLEVV